MFENAVKGAIFGLAVGDALAGIQYGMEKIPEEWLYEIAKRVEIEPLCRGFAKSL